MSTTPRNLPSTNNSSGTNNSSNTNNSSSPNVTIIDFKKDPQVDHQISQKRPKVAILLRGHTRSFRACLPSLKLYVLDEFDCDIFMHSWNATPNIVTLYRPVKTILESENDRNASKIWITMNKHNPLFSHVLPTYRNQLYCCKVLVNEMQNYSQQKKINYDCVLFMRFDTFFGPTITKSIRNMVRDRSSLAIFDRKHKGCVYSDIGFLTSYHVANEIGFFYLRAWKKNYPFSANLCGHAKELEEREHKVTDSTFCWINKSKDY